MNVKSLKGSKAYTFGFNMTLASLTIVGVLVPIIFWFAGGIEAKGELRDAADSAAFAGQSQVTEQDADSNSGFSTADWTLQTSEMQSQADTLFQKAASDKHLDQIFSNLQETAQVNGQEVTITASGTYLPTLLQAVSKRFPSVIQAVTVPMTVTVSHQYYVANKGSGSS